jgi:hypothetical protein
LLFIGLWTLADREGRLDDRPKKIKISLFPADDIDIDECLNELVKFNFIIRYEVDGDRYIQVLNFTKHQMPHHKEVASVIPAPNGYEQVTKHTYDVSSEERNEVFERDNNSCLRCGSTENLSIDHIKPLASGGDNSINNLQTLCKSCNSSKGNSIKDYRKSNVESTLNQRNFNNDASCPSDSLNLIPDSLLLIPDSLGEQSNVSENCNSEEIGKEPPRPLVTSYGSVAKALIEAGMHTLNQSNPTFTALVDAGATAQEFVDAYLEQKSKNKKSDFNYILAMVSGRRQDAKNLNLHKGALPPSSSRESGRQVAASSVFTPENTQHLQGVQLKTINEVIYEQTAITA